MKDKLMTITIILLFCCAIFDVSGAEEHDVQEVRTKYLENLHKEVCDVYINEPSVSAPYSAGTLSRETLNAALGAVNFVRYIAYLEPVELDDTLISTAQHGAVLMAANGELSHAPEQPEDMEDDFYSLGNLAAASCNLAAFNWDEDGLLSRAVEEFSRDDGAGNREILGHRRWLLYPGMLYTGFGLAQDEQGRDYVAMYVMDDSRSDMEYDTIAWPSRGSFPAEYMTTETPWSIFPNPDVYDLYRSEPRIILSESVSGAEFLFDSPQENAQGEQYFVVASGRYGDGPAYIFHPDLSEYNELAYGYQQNQVWTVRLEGMILSDGSAADAIEYVVRMISLTPIDPAAVEIYPRAQTLRIGETAALTARVIPDWADDLSVTWYSGDEEIASVDEKGAVTGVKAGKCVVTARSVNGRYDEIEITVTE